MDVFKLFGAWNISECHVGQGNQLTYYERFFVCNYNYNFKCFTTTSCWSILQLQIQAFLGVFQLVKPWNLPIPNNTVSSKYERKHCRVNTFLCVTSNGFCRASHLPVTILSSEVFHQELVLKCPILVRNTLTFPIYQSDLQGTNSDLLSGCTEYAFACKSFVYDQAQLGARPIRSLQMIRCERVWFLPQVFLVLTNNYNKCTQLNVHYTHNALFIWVVREDITLVLGTSSVTSSKVSAKTFSNK